MSGEYRYLRIQAVVHSRTDRGDEHEEDLWAMVQDRLNLIVEDPFFKEIRLMWA